MRARTLSLCEPEKAATVRRRVQTDVRVRPRTGMPPFLMTMAAFTLILPVDPTAQHFLFATLIDKQQREDLEEWKVINWHHRFCRLVPLSTKGDGNCLLHALSLAMWGVHDNPDTLRRLLSMTLQEPSHSREQIAQRFRVERAAELRQETEDDLQLDSNEWAQEWKCVVENAHIPSPTSGNHTNYPYLESVHVFVLANILRRPIVVLSSNHVLGLDGGRVGRNHMQGVYLPLLCQPQECQRTPLLLAHQGSHFTALTPCEPAEGEGRLMAVALVRADSEPLPLHYLMEEESTQIEPLLRSYMDLLHEPCLAAKLTFKAMPTDIDLLMNYDDMVEERRTYGTLPSAPPEPRHMDSIRNDPRTPEVPPPHPNHTDVWHQYRESQPTANRYPYMPSPSTPDETMTRSLTEVPEAGEPVLLSVTEHRCEVRGCRYLASVNTFPYCHEHKHLRQAAVSAPSPAPPPNHDVSVPAQMYSLTEEECRHPQCRYLASKNTFPYCHEHKMPRSRPVGVDLQQCAVPACPLRANADTLPYCHAHAAYHAHTTDPTTYTLDQFAEPVAVERERHLSLMEEMCVTPGCQFFASQNTYPYCHEHHRQRQTPSVASPAIPAPYYSSLTPDKCAVPGCGFMASQFSRPYCHEHQETLTSGPTMELSLTGEPCAIQGCRYYCSRQTAPYCHIHGGPVRAPPRQRSILDRQCASPQCQFYASGDTYPYCRAHLLSQTGPEVRNGRQRRRSTEERHSWSGASSRPPCERPVPYLQDDLQQPRCAIKGCMFLAAPAHSGLCWEHKQYRSQLDSRRAVGAYRSPAPPGCENHLMNRPCLNIKCSGIGLNVNNGLCWDCFGKQSLMQSRQPVKTAVRYRDSSMTLPRNWRTVPGREVVAKPSPFQRTMQEAEDRSRAAAARCLGNNCLNYGNAANRGYCNSCAHARRY